MIGKSIVAKFCRGWGNTLVYAFLCHPLERRQPVLPGRWSLSSLPEEFPAAAHSLLWPLANKASTTSADGVPSPLLRGSPWNLEPLTVTSDVLQES